MVKLLTLNCWGLKYVSKLRKERIRCIADRIAFPKDDDEKYDVVALQEIWCEEDWLYINEVCKQEYPYRRMFKSGIIAGPGLVILSKIPIEETFLYRFPINGRSLAFFRGDWYVGKSVSVSILNKNDGSTPLAILNSHMHAPYGKPNDDPNLEENYSTHRACQAWDFVKLIRVLKKAGYAVVQVGDLNSKFGSLPYKLFTVEGGLTDLWDQKNGFIQLDDDIRLMSLEDQIKMGGVTCDSPLNTWRKHKKPHESCRLDYALVDGDIINTVNAKVVFTEKLPLPLDCSYSDHFGYSVEFEVNSDKSNNGDVESVSNRLHIQERIDVLKDFLFELRNHQRDDIPKQIRWRKFHFFFGMIFIVIAHLLMPLVTISGPLFTTLLLLLTTVIGISAILNGLIWFFGLNSEKRALEEVEMEIENTIDSILNSH